MRKYTCTHVHNIMYVYASKHWSYYKEDRRHKKASNNNALVYVQ